MSVQGMGLNSPVTFDGSVWVRARAVSARGTVSSVPSWFRVDSGKNLIKQGATMWLDSSLVIVLVRYVRGPGFESGSGHMLFSPM